MDPVLGNAHQHGAGQLWRGGADVADALHVGFGVKDLKGEGWSARSVADVVGGEFH